MKEQESFKEALPWEIRRIIAKAIWNFMLWLLDLEFSERSKKNIQEVNELLKTHSVIMYANHTSMVPDIVLAVSLALSELTNARQIFGPVAAKYAAPDNEKILSVNYIISQVLKVLKLMGITVFPIDKPRHHTAPLSTEKKQRNRERRRRLLQAMKDRLQYPGALLGITPQGKRSEGEDGSMEKAESGIGRTAQPGSEDLIVYMAVAIILRKFSSSPAVVVGEGRTLNQILQHRGLSVDSLPESAKERDDFITQILMEDLAALQPDSMRGFYKRPKSDQFEELGV